MRAKKSLGSVVMWFASLIAGHLTLSILGAIPVAYLFGWSEVWMSGRGGLMFEGFTLPPLFWPIFMLIAAVVLVPPAYIIPLWRWCNKPQREFQEDVEKALEHVSQALNPAQLNPANPGNIHAVRYEAQKATDRIISRLKRKRRQPPGKLDLGDPFLVRTNPCNDSLQEWQDYLRNLIAE